MEIFKRRVGLLDLRIDVPPPGACERLQMYDAIVRGCNIADDANHYLSEGPTTIPSAGVIEACERARKCAPSRGHAAAVTPKDVGTIVCSAAGGKVLLAYRTQCRRPYIRCRQAATLSKHAVVFSRTYYMRKFVAYPLAGMPSASALSASARARVRRLLQPYLCPTLRVRTSKKPWPIRGTAPAWLALEFFGYDPCLHFKSIC